MNYSSILNSTLLSYSQIFFANRKWFGALLALATFINPVNGLIILLSTIFTNLIAISFGYNLKKIDEGYYGFNGLLFGAAFVFFYQKNEIFFLLLVIFLIINFFINSTVENYFSYALNLPGLSLPFLLTFYLFAIFNHTTNLLGLNFSSFQGDLHLSLLPENIQHFLQLISFIILQSSPISGLIIILAILFFSRIMFLLILIGYIYSLVFLYVLNIPSNSQLGILVSINSILISIALGGALIIPSNKSFLMSLLGVIIAGIFSLILYSILSELNLSIFVLPFNLTTFLIIYSLKFREKQGEIVLLYFKPGSPEENFYYHKNRKTRFEKYKFLNCSLPFNGEWFVSQAFDGEITHKEDWRYAFDFVIIDENGKTFDRSGLNLENYHCYNLPVLAPFKGKIVKVLDGIDDNEIGKVNIKQNWGNTVVIDHGQGLYSAISHLKKSSIKVKEGDTIEKGDIIGHCGNSGRSPEPHIHFQFQKNDKVGAATIKFPFGHYIVNNGNCLELKSYDYPQLNEKVQNLEIDQRIKEAFNFEYGDKLFVNYQSDSKVFTEKWEVKIDPYNIPFIESSTGSFATFFNDGEVFTFTSYIGNKKDALYHFYLAAIKIPFTSKKNLSWKDYYPVSMITGIPLRILSDILILISNPFEAIGRFTIKNNSNGDILFLNTITFHGAGIFEKVKFKLDYDILVDKKGFIKSFSRVISDKETINFNFIQEEQV